MLFIWLEDEPGNKPQIKEGLEEAFDAHIIIVQNEDEFLDHLKKETFSLIILDIKLPDKDAGENSNDAGLTALNKFLNDFDEMFKTPKDVPVVVLSARTDLDAKKRAFEIKNVKSFITKPPFYSDLIIACANAVGKKAN